MSGLGFSDVVTVAVAIAVTWMRLPRGIGGCATDRSGCRARRRGGCHRGRCGRAGRPGLSGGRCPRECTLLVTVRRLLALAGPHQLEDQDQAEHHEQRQREGDGGELDDVTELGKAPDVDDGYGARRRGRLPRATSAATRSALCAWSFEALAADCGAGERRVDGQLLHLPE